MPISSPAVHILLYEVREGDGRIVLITSSWTAANRVKKTSHTRYVSEAFYARGDDVA